MQTFLLVVAGVFVGLALFVLLAFGWIKQKLGGACEALMQLVQASGIPPFRIHLEANDAVTWSDAESIATATENFEAIGYVRAGDYDIREMNSVRIRAFAHPQSGFFVALYDHEEAGVFVDLFRDFDDGTSVTISTAPETGMDRPVHAPLFRVAEDVLDPATARTLHDRLAHESIGREGFDWGPEDFGQIYSEFYSQEMDWRIARGGVTRHEIERVAEMTGEGPPSDAQVEIIQSAWRCAISAFIDDEVQRVWLADSGMSAAEWEAVRDRVIVIHDQAERDDWVDALAWVIVATEVDNETADDDDYDAAHEAALVKVGAVFEGETIRDGFAKAQAMLPEKKRYERMGSVEDPWPADIWSEPVDEGF